MTRLKPLVVNLIPMFSLRNKIICAVLLIGGAIWYFMKPSAEVAATAGGPPSGAAPGGMGFGKGALRPAAVVVAPVVQGEISVINSTLGTVVPYNTVTVRAQVDGRLVSVDFKEGEIVKEGQLLAQIDPRPYEAALQLAQGQVDRDSATLRNARIDLQRYETLLKQDSIAPQQYDAQKELVKQYEGTVLAEQGSVKAAEVQLDFTKIKAPTTGRVGLRLVDAGNVVHASDPNGLLVITQMQPATAVFSVPQVFIPQFVARFKAAKEAKTKLSVEAWDSDNHHLLAKGYLDSIDNQIDTTTGTVKMRAVFPNEDEALFANQFVNVRSVLEVIPDALIIPTSGVQNGSIGTFAYVVTEDKTVKVRKLELGTTNGNRVAVLSGLNVGESVVIDGADKLRDGIKVEVGEAVPSGKRRGAKGVGGKGPGGAPAAPNADAKPMAPAAK